MRRTSIARLSIVLGALLAGLVLTVYAQQQFSFTRVERIDMNAKMAALATPNGAAAPMVQVYPVAVAVVRRPGSMAQRNATGLQPVVYQDATYDAYASSTGDGGGVGGLSARNFSGGIVNAAFGNVAVTGMSFGGQGTGPGQFNNPHGLAGDDDGNLYVADTDNHRIQKLTHSGQPIIQFGAKGSANGQLMNPYGVFVDRDGTILVADTGNHRIQRFTRTGDFLNAWGSQGQKEGQFFYPQAVIADRTGNVFVADFANNRIQKFTRDGKFLTAWGQLGSKPGQFNNPSSLAIDPQNRIWVTDLLNHRLQCFSLDGTLIGTYGTYSANASAANEFNHPRGIAISPNGDVWVAHPGVHSVDHFRMTPNAIASARPVK